MSGKAKLVLAEAYSIAERIKAAYGSCCDLIEVAGSVRRRADRCGDIELVCVPRIQTNLLGDPDGDQPTELDAKLAADVAAGRLGRPLLNGPKQKRFPLIGRGGLTVELFCVDPVEWGVAMAIRTGPAEFSRALVTERSRGGLLPDGYAVAGNRIWRRCRRDAEHHAVELADAQPTPREEDVFATCCGRWIEPWRRTAAAVFEIRLRLGLLTPGQAAIAGGAR